MDTLSNKQKEYILLFQAKELSTKLDQMRGHIISTFIYIEQVMADMVVNVAFGGDHSKYYTKFSKTASQVKLDFMKHYDKFKPYIDKYFTNKEDFESDFKQFASLRHIAAHFGWLNHNKAISNPVSIGGTAVSGAFLYAIRESVDECRILYPKVTADYGSACLKFLTPLLLVQEELYASLPNPPSQKDVDYWLALAIFPSIDFNFKSVIK